MPLIAGVILAGGQSSRMGVDKSQLTFKNQTLLERAHNLLIQSSIEPVFISGPNGIQDRYNNIGPLGGILSCLTQLTEYNYILFTPVDMPLLKKEILEKLIHKMSLDLSHLQNHRFPLILKNTAQVRKLIQKQITDNVLSLYQLFEKTEVNTIKHRFDKALFLNANSPKQWQDAKKRLRLLEP